MVFCQLYETKWHDTDANRMLRPGSMLTYFEETADLHIRSLGKSLDAMRDEDKVGFILSRMVILFYRPVGTGASLKVETWTSEGRGFSTERNFRAFDEDGIVAEAQSMWALVDVERRCPVRIANAPFTFFHEPSIGLSAPLRVSVPRELSLEKAGERRIAYSDIDYNMHMNNTRYPDMICDFMPQMEGLRMCRITMSFLHEAAYGHVLTVLRGEKDGVFYFRAVDGDTVCFEAEAEFEAVQ